MTLLGYARVSTTDQDLSLQRDALLSAGIDPNHIYEDTASGKRDDRPGLEACLKALREGDVLTVWKLDRLGRSAIHLIKTVANLNARGIKFKTLTGLPVDTTTAMGKFILTVFAGLAEVERETLVERTMAGLAAARKRGRKGGRPAKITRAKLRVLQASMGKPGTSVADLAKELGVSRATLYAHVTPNGELREAGRKVMEGR